MADTDTKWSSRKHISTEIPHKDDVRHEAVREYGKEYGLVQEAKTFLNFERDMLIRGKDANDPIPINRYDIDVGVENMGRDAVVRQIVDGAEDTKDVIKNGVRYFKENVVSLINEHPKTEDMPASYEVAAFAGFAGSWIHGAVGEIQVINELDARGYDIKDATEEEDRNENTDVHVNGASTQIKTWASASPSGTSRKAALGDADALIIARWDENNNHGINMFGVPENDVEDEDNGTNLDELL